MGHRPPGVRGAPPAVSAQRRRETHPVLVQIERHSSPWADKENRMHRVWVWTGSVAVAAMMAATVVAQAPALDVKYGLWEMSNVTNLGGQMPQIDTSRMTPEQKAK